MQVRGFCVQNPYHSKLEVSSWGGDFKNAHRSPAMKLKQIQKDPYESKGYTHASPRHAESRVKLSEATDLTVGLIGGQW